MVFIQVYHSKEWVVDDYRDPALETNITSTVTATATWDTLFEPDPKMPIFRHMQFAPHRSDCRVRIVLWG